ncbi:NAD(P)H-binding protein [bacterium]|nr:NAD(P)H-binding protein [bacterium]
MSQPASARSFDIVVYGATGFTGRLVAEHLLARYGASGPPRWAMAGRSAAKLAEVRDAIGAPADLPLIVADASDPASIDAMAKQARAVITTVGPYQLYGDGLVAACAAAGTDYLDLAGESHWIAKMIAAHEAAAKASGARLLFSSGFDSIPFDLGVYLLQEEAKARFGVHAQRVRGRVRGMSGSASGGTLASGRATMEAAQKDPSVIATLMNPFALTPGFKGADQPNGSKPYHDEVTGSWVAPFIMAPINTKAVHRTNFLLGRPWGDGFQYDEMLMTKSEAAGDGPGFDMTSNLKPGEGPSKEEREAGWYDLLFIGQTADGRTLRTSVRGDMDPGYGSTSKMLVETAICLLGADRSKLPGGAWTPAAALKDALSQRLADHAGLTFSAED